METKKFLEQLAQRFPWGDMENETPISIFRNSAGDETFLPALDAILQPYKDENPLRCVQVIDFVARGMNRSAKKETTLAHYKNPNVAKHVLPYFKALLGKDYSFRAYELLILQNIAFVHQDLKGEAIAILEEATGREWVLCGCKDQDYLKEYTFLYKGTKIEDVFKKNLLEL